ncbi:alpha/beta-hydrolase [Schizopora paradoxa]|uniref:Carboxypeptidase n=1 Tax=Schizopora paradoxa TaxID=27342 RepID=A0A0H2R6J4_9AGAM|nr:alpha/beta-hydrolase [Schizopora paradoxa]
MDLKVLSTLLLLFYLPLNSLGQAINSFPNAYPGMPSGDFSTAWQSCEFHTNQSATIRSRNISFSLNRNWAGNIPVDRAGHPNDTLFFWGFEKENGSLTANAGELSDEPWGIWLNGGPGASSMLGLMLENGPIHVLEDGSLVQNNWSWNQFVDYIWIDQPVGTGYSTADTQGYIADEDQMAEDFLGFLSNLVKIFPSLATRPLFLTGESYAGTYIPYITKALFSSPSPPVKLAKIAIGNGAMSASFEDFPTLSIIETYPQLIDYDTDVYNYFKEQTHLCGYDVNLTYPQNGIISTVPPPQTGLASADKVEALTSRRPLLRTIVKALAESTAVKRKRDPELDRRESRRREWKRDLSGRANGTIDPNYGCFLSAELEDYALNFSIPWSIFPETVDSSLDLFAPFNPYDIPDARFPGLNLDPTTFLNDNHTRTALHAPISKNWTLQISYPFNSGVSLATTNDFGDPSDPPMNFFSELASNASQNNVDIIIYSGNDDSVVPHFSSEVVIQNTTFGGILGFTRQPSTPFTDDEGNFAGIIHQERNWTYALFANAGHEVPEYVPQAAFVFFREFILGGNQTGLVVTPSSKKGATSVVGGEEKTLLVGDVLPGQTDIVYVLGLGTTSQVFPSATIAAWETFLAKQHPTQASSGGAQSCSLSISLGIISVTLLVSMTTNLVIFC